MRVSDAWGYCRGSVTDWIVSKRLVCTNDWSNGDTWILGSPTKCRMDDDSIGGKKGGGEEIEVYVEQSLSTLPMSKDAETVGMPVPSLESDVMTKM